MTFILNLLKTGKELNLTRDCLLFWILSRWKKTIENNQHKKEFGLSNFEISRCNSCCCKKTKGRSKIPVGNSLQPVELN